MKTITLTQTKSELVITEDKYHLAVSSTSLYVIERGEHSWKSIEAIIEGSDKDGLILECDDLNQMLDIILIVKKVILIEGRIDLHSHFNISGVF